MKTARELEIPVRTWVPDRIAVATVFLIMLPIAMLNARLFHLSLDKGT